MSDEEDLSVPDKQICEDRIDTFVEITKSNSAVAQQFLQENQWNLENAVSNFYQALAEETFGTASGEAEVIDLADESIVEDLFGKGKTLTNEPPPRLHLLSWNVDGLDDKCLKRRISSVVSTIKHLEPDVIFLQEVIDEVADYLEKKLPEYKTVRGNNEGYFTMIMLRIFTIKFDDFTVANYESSMMGRNALICRAHVGQRRFAFINTHLESGKDYSEQRQKQLKRAFSIGNSMPPQVTVVVGGDLNLRDSEAHVPSDYQDAWVACGSRPEAKWTWDTTRNTNKGIGGGPRGGPRCRFDRLFVRPESRHVQMTDFGLVGLTRVPNTQMFPSDHWGIRVNFNLKH